MGWFSKASSCEEVGAAVAKQCAIIITEHFRRKDVMDYDVTIKEELLALTIVAHRLGVQFTSLPKEKTARVLTAFDKTLAQMCTLDTINDLLDQRGAQYFTMLNNHVDEFNKGNSRPFVDELMFRFEQFCAGGGEEGAPIILDAGITSMFARGREANMIFAKSFTGARNLIAKQKWTGDVWIQPLEKQTSKTGTEKKLQARSQDDLSVSRQKAAQDCKEAVERVRLATEQKAAAERIRFAAEQGDANSQTILGTYFVLGKGVPKDDKEAAKWFSLAAEQGFAEGQYNLGECHFLGRGVPKDYKEAVRWFSLAVKQGAVGATFYLGLAYYFGRGVPEDYAQAYAWLNVAATQGNSRAAELRSDCQKKMTPVQIEEGQLLSREYTAKFEKSGTQEARRGLDRVGEHTRGEQKKSDVMRQKAEQGDADAQYQLGLFYYSRADDEKVCRNEQERQSEKAWAFAWFVKAADHGHSEANERVGFCSMFGIGTDVDYKEAMKRFLCAAASGNAKAQWGVGSCYIGGRGVPQDYDEGIRWMLKAAEGGDMHAQSTMSTACDGVYGQPRDADMSLKWCQLAANQGHSMCLCEMAERHCEGNLVDKDVVKAFAYITAAFRVENNKNTDRLCAERRSHFRKQMTAEQIAEGKRLAGEYAAKFVKE